MAGYYIYSVDGAAFQQLITSPSLKQCRILAKSIVDELEDLIDEYGGEAVSVWPLDEEELAEAIQQRLTAADWYADLTMGDAHVWDSILYQLTDEPGQKLGIGFECENDGFLYWDAPAIAAVHGAPMMAEPDFGNSGFRYSGRSQGDIDLMYTLYLPEQTKQLLSQLEKAVPYFETLPVDADGDRAQFFEGLLEPVRKIVAAGRVMWVQTDT